MIKDWKSVLLITLAMFVVRIVSINYPEPNILIVVPMYWVAYFMVSFGVKIDREGNTK